MVTVALPGEPTVYAALVERLSATASWINLGDITATNETGVVSDAIATDSQRFYRVISLP